MKFKLPLYKSPDFKEVSFLNMPAAVFKAVKKDGVAPGNFHATSNFPEYIQVKKGVWELCARSRMDCVVVQKGSGLFVTEFRRLKKGDKVLVGRTENGENGIYVHVDGFETEQKKGEEKFQFRSRQTRESSFSKDYDLLYSLLEYEKKHGYIVWVLGPAVTFDKDCRDALSALINNGYAHAVMAGNALATHDTEAAVFCTGLGQDIYHKKNYPLGHYNHLDVINEVRSVGSLKKATKVLKIKNGIIKACFNKNIPFVLAGSIRDDGPLPEVVGDVYKAQDAMRVYAKKATTVIAIATQLHSIAFGNMIPAYSVNKDGKVRPVYYYIVDISEFAVDKLANRGSSQVAGISTNAQDFCVNLKRALC